MPREVEANLAWTRRLLGNCSSVQGQRALIERMKRYFAKESKVAERTIERLTPMGDAL